MKRFFLERWLPTSLLLELNKKPRTYKRKQSKMFVRTENLEGIDENPENINLEKNVILCTPSNVDVFKQNIDGTISFSLQRDENLSAGKTRENGTIFILDYLPYVKMSIPQGIKVNIDDPSFDFCFIEKIYPHCEMFHQEGHETELPPYVIMSDFKITFHIDLKRLRDSRGSFLLKKGQRIANIYFTELPHFREYGETLDKIIYIRNTEIYETFIDVF